MYVRERSGIINVIDKGLGLCNQRRDCAFYIIAQEGGGRRGDMVLRRDTTVSKGRGCIVYHSWGSGLRAWESRLGS